MYRASCEAGEPLGCEATGDALRLGRGVARDLAEAARFYEKGCEGGGRGAATISRSCMPRATASSATSREGEELLREGLPGWIRARMQARGQLKAAQGPGHSRFPISTDVGPRAYMNLIPVSEEWALRRGSGSGSSACGSQDLHVDVVAAEIRRATRWLRSGSRASLYVAASSRRSLTTCMSPSAPGGVAGLVRLSARRRRATRSRRPAAQHATQGGTSAQATWLTTRPRRRTDARRSRAKIQSSSSANKTIG
jgi:hypothetical protein